MVQDMTPPEIDDQVMLKAVNPEIVGELDRAIDGQVDGDRTSTTTTGFGAIIEPAAVSSPQLDEIVRQIAGFVIDRDGEAIGRAFGPPTL